VKLEDQFLRHMLETLTRYASFDLTVEATGTILTTWWRTSP
jgi:imidazoleglycerol phosphate dehydratase HisB